MSLYNLPTGCEVRAELNGGGLNMCDPLSITTGVVTLLGACLKVSIELKKLRNGAAESKPMVAAMLNDVYSLRDVLQVIETSFDELDSGPELVGDIGNHWWNLRISLQDGFDGLTRFEALLLKVNKEVGTLDSVRRYARIQAASSEIAAHRQEIQAYRDTLQLSLQTVTL